MRSSASVLAALAVAAAPLAVPAAAQTPSADLLDGLPFRELGPAIMGGRISDIAVVEDDPRIFYVGTATAGVWKTTNHGTTWTPVFEDEETSSVGAVAVAPSNRNVVWVGTGEPQNRQSSPWGAGVYRSTDAGRSFEHVGLTETRHVARIRVHPRDPDVAYVAAVGHLWGPNEERGVYRTTDGGETWEKVLFVDEDTGVIDLVMDPGDPRTLFAATYERRRTPFGFNGGGPGSGIWRTTDGGDTWRRLENGLPRGQMGRIGLDVYRRDGNMVFAVVQAEGDGEGFYRSTDRGETWEKLSDENPRPMYYSQVRVDPNDPERIFLGGADLYRSDDGGRTWTDEAAPTVHLDHHALWIDPADSDHILLGGDGGFSASFDGSASWRMYDNLPLAQFYEIGYDMADPYTVCGGLQDNGSWCAPTDTRTDLGIRNRDWININGGDGFYVEIDPDDPRIGFTESQNGNIRRIDFLTGERISVRPEPGDDDEEYRWNWNAPIVISAHDPATVYVGANKLLRSRDRGQSWEEASGDLTHDVDRTRIPILGRMERDGFLSRHDGTRYYSTLTTIGESPLDPELVYTGSDDGRLMRTRNGGRSWDDLTDEVPGLPERTYVSRVVPSAHRPGVVYATFDRHQDDDYRPFVYRSDDFGESWTSLSEGLPPWSVNVLAEHPGNPDLLFVGSEVGLHVSTDRGRTWTTLDGGFPTVPVDDLAIHPRENDLIVGTHGRGVWLLEDLAALEGLTPAVVASTAHLFPVRDVEMYNVRGTQGWYADAEFERPNPPVGARVRYWLGEDLSRPVVDEAGADGAAARGPAPPGDGGAVARARRAGDPSPVRITILDANGREVRHLDGPATAGIHEVVWDLRVDPPYETEEGRSPDGHPVLPGTYTVRLEAGGVRRETPVRVSLDPRIRVTRADLEARQRLMEEADELAEPLWRAGRAVDRMEEQLDDVEALLEEAGDVPGRVRDALASAREELDEVSDDLDDVRGDARSGAQADGAHAAPTEQMVRDVARAWEAAPGVVERVNGLITRTLPELYRLLDEHGVRPDPGEPIPVPRRGGG